MSIDHIYDFYHGRRYSSILTPKPDPNIYPNYYKAKRLEIILHEGEQLFIPMGWFHHVFSESVHPTSGINLALNFWKKTNHTEYDLSLKEVLNPTLPYYDTVSLDCYETHEKQNTPFLTKSSNIVDVSTFLDRYKDLKVFYKTSKTPHFPSNNMIKDVYIQHECTLNEFVMFKHDISNFYYLQQCDISSTEYTPSFFKNVFETNIWLNFGQVNTMNHYDGYENILYQIHGTRRIYLFPPCERFNLYLYNPFDLQFIIKTYNQLKHQSKQNTVKDTYIQWFDYSLPIELCEKIISYQKSNVQLHDLDPSLDQYVFTRINAYIYSYIHLITTQFKRIDISQCEDTGYFVQEINEKINEISPKNQSILKYKWFLNDSTPTYVNGVQVDAKQGRLLIYPSHFTYHEYEEEHVKNKWICYGYIYPRRDSNPQSYD